MNETERLAEDLKIGDTIYGETITKIEILSDPWIRFTTTKMFFGTEQGSRIQDIESWQNVTS